MVVVIRIGWMEEDMAMFPDVVVLRWANTGLVILIPEFLDWLLNCMAWTAAIARLSNDLWFFIHTTAYRNQKSTLIFVRAMDVPWFHQAF